MDSSAAVKFPDVNQENDFLRAEFHGQQEGERILHRFNQHWISLVFGILKVTFVSVVLASLGLFASRFLPALTDSITQYSYITAGVVWLVGLWWALKVHRESSTVITDRRVIRFEPVFPIFSRKRALFWTNVLKCKGFSTNILLRLFKIGKLTVHPLTGEDDNIECRYVYYYDDLANYIDKILFVVKHTPTELSSLRAFIAKPKGSRY